MIGDSEPVGPRAARGGESEYRRPIVCRADAHAAPLRPFPPPIALWVISILAHALTPSLRVCLHVKNSFNLHPIGGTGKRVEPPRSSQSEARIRQWVLMKQAPVLIESAGRQINAIAGFPLAGLLRRLPLSPCEGCYANAPFCVNVSCLALVTTVFRRSGI